MTEAIVKPAVRVLKPPTRKVKFGRYAPDNVTRNLKVVLFGESGAGKTSMASTFPDPLFLDLDDGMRSVANKNLLRYPANPNEVVTDYGEIEEFRAQVYEDLENGSAPFKTVVVDGLNDLRIRIMDNILTTINADRLYQDQPNLQDYGKLKRDTMTTFYDFLLLPCNVVFIASAIIPEYEDNQIVPDLGSCTVEICRKVDLVGYCYTVAKGDEIKNMVSFASTPKHYGKDRLGVGTASKPNDYRFLFSKIDKPAVQPPAQPAAKVAN